MKQKTSRSWGSREQPHALNAVVVKSYIGQDAQSKRKQHRGDAMSDIGNR